MPDAILNLDSSVVINSDVLVARVGEGTVLLDPSKNDYYDTGPVGGAILGLVEQPITVGHLCERSIEQFEIDADRCQQEVMEFLHVAIGAGIVRRAGSTE